jgi:hypothetical protein
VPSSGTLTSDRLHEEEAMANKQEPLNTDSGDPEEKVGPTNRSTAILVAVITAVAGLLTTIITVANSGHGVSASSTPPTVMTQAPSNTVQPQSPTGSTAGCLSKLMMSSPASGQHVAGVVGVQLSGAACGLANEYGWVFDHDIEDHYYYEVYPSSQAGRHHQVHAEPHRRGHPSIASHIRSEGNR